MSSPYRIEKQVGTGSIALWRTSSRRLLRRPFQYILLILGVAIGVAMVVSIDVANQSAGRAFELSTEAVAGKTTHRIFGPPTGIDESLYTRIKTELGYRLAAPVVEDFVLSDKLGDRPLRLIGVDLIAEPHFRNYFGDLDGETITRLATLLFEPNNVILSEGLAQEYGLVPGDLINIKSGTKNVTVRLVAVFDSGGDNQSLSDFLLTDIATAQETVGMLGKLSHIDLIDDEEDGLSRVATILPAGVQLQPAAIRNNALRQMSSAFELNLTALSLLAMVVGMFLIYNVVAFSIVQRRELFGILRCLGVTGSQLSNLILWEATIMGLCGAVLGLGIGLLLGREMVSLVSRTINDFYFVVNVTGIHLSAWILIKGLIIGIGASLLGSIVPAWEVKRTTPVSGLHRSTLEEKTGRATGQLVIVFILLLILGGTLLFFDGANLILNFAGLFIVLISFAFLVPGLLQQFMTLSTPLFRRLFGVIGRMAPRDIVRSISRTAVAVAALMIAVSVIIGVAIMIGSFRQTVDQWLSDTLQADIFLSPPSLTTNRVAGNLPSEIVKDSRSWPGVDWSVSVWNADIMAPVIGRQIEVIAVDGDISAGNRRYAWIAGTPKDVWQQLEQGQGVLVSEPLIIQERLDLPPDPIHLLTDSGPVQFPILGVFYDYSSDQGAILMDQNLYKRWWSEQGINSLGLFVEQGQDVESITRSLQHHFSGREDVIIQTNKTVRSNALEIFDRTFAITAALQLLAIIVAFIGVLSALMSIQLDRTRELGILRATGMTISQMWRLILLETGLMGGTAGLLAMPLGTILAWILIYIINRRSFGWTLDMNLDPIYYLQSLAVAILSALLAGVLPSIRAGRLSVASAIREE